MGRIAWLDPTSLEFPPVSMALDEPNGLLAAGGDLSTERLLAAYRHGIFPWYEEGQPLLWWSPSPRCVLYPERLNISRSLRKRLRRNEFDVRLNTAFAAVVDGCRAPRDGDAGTWITSDMRRAYLRLHELGLAQSVETWRDGELVGGLYGVSLGRVFFGESMFHRATDASKVAMAYLCRLMVRYDGPLIDCQVDNEHLERLGAEFMPRTEFVAALDQYTAASAGSIPWHEMRADLGPW